MSMPKGHIRVFGAPSPAQVLHRPVVADVTGARALDVIYQNLTGRPLLCIVTFNMTKLAANDDAFVEVETGVASPPLLLRGDTGYMGVAGSGPQRAIFCLSFVVPSNIYYRVADRKAGTGTIAIRHWIEVTL